MPTLIDVKIGTLEGAFSLQMVQNWVQLQQDFSLTYYVIADNQSQTHVDIIATTGLPVIGSIVFGATCMKVNPKVTESVIHYITGVWTQLWEVNVEFSTSVRSPTNQAPEVTWGGEVDKERLNFDLLTGAKPTTTAGEPLFMDRDVVHPILKIRRQEPYPFDPNTSLLFSGRTNLTSFWGFPPGTCLMMPIMVEEDTQENIRVCWVTYEIKINVAWNFDGTMKSNTWQIYPLNQGYQIRKTIGGRPEINLDKHNHPLRVNLDQNGLELKNLNGTNLGIGGIINTPAANYLFVYDVTLATVPVSSDIGSIFVINAASPAGWNPGEYPIVGIKTIVGPGPVWLVQGNIGTPTTTGGIWEIQRSPISLIFNRAYPAEFNALSLGPY